MPEVTVLIILVVAIALAFDYINGFHDTANAIATVVSTRVLTPRTAIAMAAILNFAGAFFSKNVAETVAKGLVDPKSTTQVVVLAALTGAIVWNLITWRFGIPSSSSHALVGGLVGAAIAHGGMGIVLWQGVRQKVLIPMIGSPLIGFAGGFVLMFLIYRIFARANPGTVSSIFRKLQVVSSAGMAFMHGSNDAQKSMGIITMALLSQKYIHTTQVPTWVMISCAIAMGLGTAGGGWRIIKTMGHKIIRLEPVHGFAAETTAALTILAATHYKMPVSTTHTIAGSIFGVGSSKRLSAVRWGVAQGMVVAWVITIPASALVSWGSMHVFTMMGLR